MQAPQRPRLLALRSADHLVRASAIALTSLAALSVGSAAQTPSQGGLGQEQAQDAPLALGPPIDIEARSAKEKALAALVSDNRASKAVRSLVALGPRMGGTDSGAKAANWLEERFKETGLQVQRHLAPTKWCHQETDWSVKASIDGADPIELKRAWPLGFSPASRGEALLQLEAAPGAALLDGSFRSTKRGEEPCAVVLSDGVTTIDGEWPLCRSHARRQRARVAVFGISKPEGKILRDALEAGKAVTLKWHLETTVAEAQPITVVATLPAAAPGAGAAKPAGDTAGAAVARPHLLICAHGDSDSGGPGANDNASGVAIVLEIARAWTKAIASGDLPAPPMEVRFAIWGSEIHSTKAYRDSDLGRGVVAVINFDQAGFGSTADRLHVEPDDLAANEPFVRIAAGLLAEYAGEPGFPKEWATNKSLGGTDSYIFSGWKRFREEGFPSVTLFTSAWGKPDQQPKTKGMPGQSWEDADTVEMDYDLHYHSSGDTPENTTDLEPDNMGWCARIGLLSSLRYLDAIREH